MNRIKFIKFSRRKNAQRVLVGKELARIKPNWDLKN